MKISPVLWSRPLKNGLYQIKIRVYQNGKSSFLNTGYSVERKYWNPKTHNVRSSHPDENEINTIITQLVLKIRQDSTNELSSPKGVHTVRSVFLELIREFESLNSIGVSKRYKVVLKHLETCRLDNKSINDFSNDDRVLFNTHLSSNARIAMNTQASYNKVLRRVFNYCKEKKYLINSNPYEGVKIKDGATKSKNSLNHNQLNDLKEAIIGEKMNVSNRLTTMAMFIFSLHSYGMRFSDVVTLKWSNFNDGKLKYVTRKDNKTHITVNLLEEHYELLRLFIPQPYYVSVFENGLFRDGFNTSSLTTLQAELYNVELEYYEFRRLIYQRADSIEQSTRDRELVAAQLNPTEKNTFSKLIQRRSALNKKLVDSYLNSYADNKSNYVFPMLPNKRMTAKEEHSLIGSKNTIVNSNLKLISQALGIPKISFHCARHSFAVNQYLATKDIYSLSRALHHKSISVTTEYLVSLDLDIANETNKEFSKESRDSYTF